MQRQPFYLSRAKRILFTAAFAILFAILFAVAVYLTWQQFAAERYALAAAGLGACLALSGLFGLATQEAHRSLTRRGYARPEGESGFERVTRLIFQATPQASHPAGYKRAVKRIRFDDGSVVDVDLGKLFWVLQREYRQESVLPWVRCIRQEKMDKRQWAAYREVLRRAGVVDVNGRGAMFLNCTPWAAIEQIQNQD